MRRARRRWSVALCSVAVLAVMAPASVCRAQNALALDDGRWEATLDGRVGAPVGRLKVGEFPTGDQRAPGNIGSPGTNLRLHDLGIDMSEAVEASLAYRFTPRDAVRASFLYYFLDGRTTLNRSVFYNGPEFLPGALDTNADYYRLSLDYERTILSRPSRERVVITAGLTYVNFNPTLTGANRTGTFSSEGSARSNSEDFYRQELPVPILGVRWDHPLTPRLLLRTSVSGGYLPGVDSLRTEGGGIYLWQGHADGGLALAYALTSNVDLEVGYHLTYFFQEERSKEDKNVFELIDNALQVGVRVRF